MRIVPDSRSIVSIGFRSDRLEVIGPAFFAKSGCEPYARQYAVCRCDCGAFEVIPAKTLIRANATRSCGCLVDEHAKAMGMANAGEANGGHKHGGIHDPLYRNWAKMKARCENPKQKGYHRYGGRGITIAPEWQDFAVFREWWALANGFRPGLTIDRKLNDGNYEPGNCQWLTSSENSKKAWADGCLDHRFPNKARVAKRPEAG